jgi:hypothetical protein
VSILKAFRAQKAPQAEAATAECQHWELAPRWSDASSIGKKELITHYACAGCGATLLPSEVRDRNK